MRVVLTEISLKRVNRGKFRGWRSQDRNKWGGRYNLEYANLAQPRELQIKIIKMNQDEGFKLDNNLGQDHQYILWETELIEANLIKFKVRRIDLVTTKVTSF